MSSKRVVFIKWCAFLLHFAIGMLGLCILAAALCLLFDSYFSHLLFQGNGSYYSGHILLASGASLAVVGITGCIGIYRESCCLLCSSLVFLAMFTILQILFGVATYTHISHFQERVHFSLFWAVQRNYGHDIPNTTVVDLIQQGWKCCGLSSYTSWSNSLYSKRHIPKGIKPTNTFIVPKSCCIEPSSSNCELIHTSGIRSGGVSMVHTLHSEGCGPRLMNAINLYSKWVFILGSGLVCAEVVSVVLSTLTIFYIKRGHSIRFECIKSEESTTALTSTQDGPGSSTYTASSTLLLPDMPISSLV